MPVICAGELDDAIPAGHAAGETHGRHGRLGARGDETHHLDGIDRGDDPLRQLDLELDRMPVGDPALQLLAYRPQDLGRLVTQDVRPVGQDVVDEVLAVGVEDVCTRRANDVRGHAGDGAICADGTVNAPRQHTFGTLTKRTSLVIPHVVPRGARSARAR